MRDIHARSGIDVIGHVLPDVPEEIIHSCGALSFGIQGAGAAGSRAGAVFPAFTCNHAAGALELGMSGALSFMKGIVIPYVCDTTRNLGHLWPRLVPGPKAEFLRLPKRLDFPDVKEYLRAEFTRIAAALGRTTGRPPTDEGLHDAIRLFNKTRRLLRLAYDKHGKHSDSWTMTRLHRLLCASTALPRQDLLDKLERLPFEETPATAETRTRKQLYLKGKVWDPPYLASILDELDFVLVGDELVTGLRSIAVDASEEGDPIEALVDRHLALTTYPGFHVDARDAVRAFRDRVASTGAKAVLFVNPKFCEAAAFDTPDFRSALEKDGIPSLVLETSAGGVSPAQIRVRLEAFREMISDELS
jgi:benzoyl-CoA reductase/2-hydroxyglutaryl-CoA dehydratase subunit BcrC/BadD/HgdB